MNAPGSDRHRHGAPRARRVIPLAAFASAIASLVFAAAYFAS